VNRKLLRIAFVFAYTSAVANPGHLRNWIEARPEEGRYFFTRDDLATVSEASDTAIRMTLYRLKKAGAVVSPRRDFFIVVPREYRAAGCPPASWFVDALMRHLGRRYYVGLLSAAALQGAGHQQPMAFQVMVDRPEREIAVGRVRIDFHASRLVASAATLSFPTETGTMVVSTPETTAFDLVRFPSACGSWNNVATVLSELAERLEADALVSAASRVARSDVQRLGWLLDAVAQPTLADALASMLAGRRLLPTLLSSSRDASGAPLDPRWHVLVNDVVEPDT